MASHCLLRLQLMKTVEHGLTQKRNECQQENSTASFTEFPELSEDERRRQEKRKHENRRDRRGKSREGTYDPLTRFLLFRLLQLFRLFLLLQLCLGSKFILK